MFVDAELPLFDVDIPRLAVYRKAASEGDIVGQVQRDKANNSPSQRAWLAYEQVGKKVLALKV